MFELSFIWAGIIAFSVLTYVILDGFEIKSGWTDRTNAHVRQG